MKKFSHTLLSYIRKDEEGFSLIEALVAMVVLTIGILSAYMMQINAIEGNSRASHVTIASNWATQRIERITNIPFDDLVDTDGDGTDQDINVPFGVDDDGGNFGLDDLTAATADGQANSPDQAFTIFWNVAENYPVIGVKTVRVHVQDNNLGLNYIGTNTLTNTQTNSMVSMQYVKQGSI